MAEFQTWNSDRYQQEVALALIEAENDVEKVCGHVPRMAQAPYAHLRGPAAAPSAYRSCI